MENALTPSIENRIFTIRGRQVMLDRDLAAIYDVNTLRLNEQVRRNLTRFPESFSFYLTKEELNFWISHFATSKAIKMGMRKPPRVFTEYGVAMVSSIINSQRAIEVSVQIIHAFVSMKKAMMQGTLLSQRLSNTEQMLVFHERKIEDLYKRMEGIELPKHGIFFNNQIFDAYTFFIELIQRANKSIILIDNYIDHTVLLQLAKRKEEVAATIYSERISASLRLDLEKHNTQYPTIDIHPMPHIHDRFLVIDRKVLYQIGASIKDLGKKWFAFSRMDSLVGAVLQKLQVVNGEW